MEAGRKAVVKFYHNLVTVVMVTLMMVMVTLMKVTLMKVGMGMMMVAR